MSPSLSAADGLCKDKFTRKDKERDGDKSK
jgi:hypothetical protein